MLALVRDGVVYDLMDVTDVDLRSRDVAEDIMYQIQNGLSELNDD